MKSLMIMLAMMAAFCTLIGLAGCEKNEDDDDDQSEPDDDTPTNDDDNLDDDSSADDDQDGFTYPFCSVDEAALEQMLNQMTLPEKVAQLYIVGVIWSPWFPIEETRALIQDLGVGGVYVQPLTGIGFWPEWTAQNMNQLQELAMARALPIPLLVTLDQEGGIPQSMIAINGGTDQPGNMGLGASGDPNNTYLSYGMLGEELAAVGLKVDYAPVAELMVDPYETSMYTRCFGELTEDITAHVSQAVRGLQENLVVATAKHFPSHSTAPGDEHFTLTVNTDNEQTVREKYLPPFIAAIEAGTSMIMMTHSVYTAWEDDLPSVFSRRIVTDLLREELGYTGVVVTDDINMGAISLHEWDEMPDVMALAAGVDMIVDCGANNPSIFGYVEGNLKYPHTVKEQIDYVVAAVQDGRLDESAINASVRRILRTKMMYCLFEQPYVDVAAARQKTQTAEHIATSLDLHKQAFTVVRNDEGLFPLDMDSEAKVHVVAPAFFQIELYPDCAWGNIAGTDLVREVQKIQPAATGDTFIVGPLPINVAKLVNNAAASGAETLIVGTYNALYYEQQIELVEQLLELGLPTIVIALAMPYDLMAFPDTSTYLVTYSNRDLALEAAVQVLFGESEPQGRLPVSIPGFYDVGWNADQRAGD